MKKAVIVSDTANDSLTNQEVRTVIEGFLNDPGYPNISFVSSTPSTIHTAFLISQIVQTEEEYGRPLETVIYQNTDPRLQNEQVVEEPAGAQFIVIHLASGMYICGPNAGFDFSLIKPKIEEVYLYRGINKESQFRSRDGYLRVVAHLMDALEDDLDLEEVSSNIILSLDGFYIGHVDNFGTIKTTITKEDIQEKYHYDDLVTIKINNVEQKARYVSGLFGGTPGELVIYPGYSGVKDNPYLDISVWRRFTQDEKTSGSNAFNNATPGMKVEIL